MLIEVRRTGGIAGMTRRGVIDTESVPDATAWQALVDAARPYLAQLQTGTSAGSVRDGFSWTLSVDDQSCHTDDAALTGPLRDLAERTLREGRVR